MTSPKDKKYIWKKNTNKNTLIKAQKLNKEILKACCISYCSLEQSEKGVCANEVTDEDTNKPFFQYLASKKILIKINTQSMHPIGQSGNPVIKDRGNLMWLANTTTFL